MSIEAAFFGALGRDAERKRSAAGTEFVRLAVRVGDGDKAQWVSVLAFEREVIGDAEKLTKGTRVYIEGKLSFDEWTAADGNKRTGLSVVSWHCRPANIGRDRIVRDRSF